MITRKCPRCSGVCYIDSWGGWRWSCVHCDYVGRKASDNNIREMEAYESGHKSKTTEKKVSNG